MSGIILVADKHGNPVGGVGSQQQMRANARSILSDRLALGSYGTAFGGKRDYYEVLGYTPEPTIDDYRVRFERDPVAGKVVEFPAEETWRDTPTVKDGRDKEASDDTEFCRTWSDFAERMRAYHYMQRVDVQAGIGRFGLLHIGVAGSSDLATEVNRVNSINDILYLRPYGEDSVSVAEWQTNPANPRYGLPHIYRVETGHMTGSGSAVLGTRPLLVHWSRCIHVAEGLLDNEVYGRPRLQRVVNLLDDILKVVGGSAEATWKLMRKGFVLNLDAEMDDMDAAASEMLSEQFDEYDHGLRRFVKTKGLNVQDLGSEVVDPSGIFGIILTLISVATRIPKRILQGSERGELASSQDATNWAGYIAGRQLNFAEPAILRPLIDRLLKWGALPQPVSGRYICVWDSLFEMSDTEKANLANLWAQAIQKASVALGHPVATAEEFRGEFTPFPDKLPPVLEQARELAQRAPAPVMPEEGQDVLDQVAEVVANHGFNQAQGRAMILAMARIITRQAT